MMTDQEIQALELEASNLRRHFRVMSIPAAYRALFRLWLGSWFLTLGESLVRPHASSGTGRAFGAALLHLANDCDIATEGWNEAAEISRKTLNW